MITVIGVDGSPLSDVAAEAVAGATLLVGGRRHLSAAGATSIPRVIVLGPLRPALDALAAHDGDAVVLASGDPGFFGIVRALRERGLGCTVLPAVSSVARAFARAGLPWDDAVVVSAHGRELRAAVNVCRAYRKVAVLTGPGQGPAEIGAALAGWPRRLAGGRGPGRRRRTDHRVHPRRRCRPHLDGPQRGPGPRVWAPQALPRLRRRPVRDQPIGVAGTTPIS